MKSPRILAGSILAVLAVSRAAAATLLWDTNAATAPNPLDGANTWDVVNARFWNGTANVIWNNANNDIASFGLGGGIFNGVAGNVTVSGALTAGGLQFNEHLGNAAKYNITGGTSLTLAGASPTIVMNTSFTRPFAAINTVLAGTSGFTVSGNSASILEFGTQANTITGGYRLAGANLAIGSDSGLGGAGNSLTFAANSSLIVRTTMTAAAARTLTINSGVTGTIDSLNGITTTIAGVVAGAGHFEKSGLGAVTLQNANTYAGDTRVRQGTLTLDFSAATAPATNMVSGGSALRLYGGTLAATGKAGSVTSQTFSGTTLNPGASGLSLNLNGATSLTVNLGDITRNSGATLNVATIAAGTTYTTSSSFSNAVGWGTVNNADFLTIAGSNLAPLGTYQSSNDPTLWAAADNVTLAADPTSGLGTTSINSLRTTAASAITVNAGETFTLGSGGILATGTGSVSISGGTLKGASGGDLIVHQHNTANALTIGSIIADNGNSGLTKSGAGTLVLDGANTYAGNTFVNAGRLDVSSDANLGLGSTVTLRAGTTLGITGSTAFSSAKNFQFDFGSNTYGAAALGAAQGSVGNFNVNVSNTAGATVSGAFNVTAGTFVKTGAGSLTLTNGGINRLAAINGGLAFTVEQGGITFDGGAGSEWVVSQGEFNIGIGDNATAAATRSATATLNSGTVRTGSWTALGRGNGNIGNTATLNINGGSWNSGNFYTGFANGVAGYNAASVVNITNGGVLNVGDNMRLAESAGGTTSVTVSNTGKINVNNAPLQVGFGAAATMTLNDSASVIVGAGGATGLVNGNLEVGTTGRGLVKLTGSNTSINVFQTLVGNGAGSGAIWNRGQYINRSGASTNHFALGNGAGGYGYFLNDTPIATNLQEIGVGGAGGGSGVLEIRSGTMNISQWVTLNRTNSANATSAQLLISGGTLVPNNLAGRFYANQVATAALTTYINIGAGGRIQGGNVADINLNNSALAGHQTTLSIYEGGIVETPRVFAAQGNGTAAVVFNNGTLKATAAGNVLDTNLDAVIINPNGATIDTNGFAVTTGANPLIAPIGTGLSTIPLASNGAGYIGRPIVKITDPTGVGASAVANFDETTGQLTGITITSPGSNYTAPTITLVGGGFSTAATLGAAALAANANTGGLIKSGAGTLTLSSAASSYGGSTTIRGGTLSIATISNGGVNSTIGASSSAAGNLIFDGGALQYTGATATTDRGFTVNPGITGIIDIPSAATVLTVSGGTAATTGGLTKAGDGVLSLTGTSAYTGTTSVNGGVLGIAGALGGALNVNSGGTLNAAHQAVGALTVPTLTLANGSSVEFDFGAGNDVLTISNPGGLALGTTSLRIYQAGGSTPFTTNGTYTLFDYTTSFSGALTGAFTVSNSQPGKIYSIANNPGATAIELTIGDAQLTTWNVDGGGSWNVAGNWTAGVPNGIGAAATFAGVLTGPNAPASVSVDGPKTVGSIVFNNTNSYSVTGAPADVITLNNGLGTASISAAAGSHTLSAPVALVGPTSLNADAGATLEISGALDGAVAVTKTGNGTLVLSGTNSYLGTAISGGTLQVGANGAAGTLGSGAVSVASGATLSLNRSDVISIANNISGTGALTQAGTGTVTYTGNATHTGATAVTAGHFINEGTLSGTSSFTVNSATATLRAGSTTSVTGGTNIASIAGTATLNIEGSANATLTGAINVATASGGNGTLSIDTTGVVTTPATITVGSGAGATGTMNVKNGTLTQGGASAILIGNNGSTGSNYTQTGGNVTAGTGHFQVGVGNTGTSATATISAGTLLSNAEIWASNGAGNTGTINVSGTGTMTANSWIAVGRLGGTGALNISGGTVTKAGTNATHVIVGSIAGTGSTIQTAGALNVSQGDIRLGENSAAVPSIGNVWDISGGTSSVQGTIQIAWRSSSADWNVSGDASVTASRLAVGAETSNATAGPAVGNVSISGGTVNINGSGTESRIGGDIAGSTTSQGSMLVSGGQVNFAGNLQIGGYGIGSLAQTGGVINVNTWPAVGRYAGSNGTLIVVDGTFNQTNPTTALIVGEDGTGTVTVTGTGVINTQGLRIGHGVTGAGTVNLDGGILATGLVQKTSAASSAAFKFNGGVLKATASAPDFFLGMPSSAITVESGGAIIDTNGNSVTITQGLANGAGADGGLRKTGLGTLTLTGASTFVGATVIDGGVLNISGSLSGTSSVTVNDGGMLAGTGSIASALTTVSAGGKLAPGASPGTLAFIGGLNITAAVNSAGTESLVFELGSVSDRITLSGGTLTIGTGVLEFDDFKFSDSGGFDNGTYTLFDTTLPIAGSLGANISGFVLGDKFGTLGFADGGNDIVLTVVPEPASGLLLIGGLALLARRRRTAI